MYCLLAQLNIALWRLDSDEGGWMQPLIFAVVAFIYVISSIIKAKTKKPEAEGEEQLKGKPVRKPPMVGRGVQRQIVKQPVKVAEVGPRREYRPAEKPQSRKAARPQSAARKVAAILEQAIQGQFAEVPVVPKLPEQIRPVQPEFEELPEYTGKAVGKLRGKPAAAEVDEEYLSEILDYADPDELKRAILHYEILGKAVSMRNPSERMAGF